VIDDSKDNGRKVSLKKAVAALETLIQEIEALPAAKDAKAKESQTVEGMRKQLAGMVLSLKGACGRNGDDFSFPSA
jgi:hypothetical protein